MPGPGSRVDPISLTGEHLWSMREVNARRATMAAARCYVDRVADDWVVLVVQDHDTIASEMFRTRELALRRANELRAMMLRQGWTESGTA